VETKKILVTGGAGFIGANLVKELRSRGHEVTAIDLFNTDRDNYVRADVRHFRQLERVFEQGLQKVHEWFVENWADITKSAEF
jgi:dTDP-glucose 4,6-dehydratase